MARSRKDDLAESGPPTRFAEGPPPPEQQGTGLPLVAVMEIQRTLGGLTTSVQALQDAQRTMQTELTSISQKVHTAQTVGWVVGAGLMLVIGLVGWIITNAINLLPSLIHSTK